MNRNYPLDFLNFSAQIAEGGVRFAEGTTVPTDGTAGYAKGCQFRDTDASSGAMVYVNNGSVTSCDFDVLIDANSTQTLGGAKTVSSNITTTVGTLTATGDANVTGRVVEAGYDPSLRTFARSDFGKRIYTKTVASDWVSYKSMASGDLDWFMSGNGTLFGGAVSTNGGAVISCSNTSKIAFIKPATGSPFKKIAWSSSKSPRFRAVIATGTTANTTIICGLYSSQVAKTLSTATPYSNRAEFVLRQSVDSKWHARVGGATSISGGALGSTVTDNTVYDLEIRVDSSRIATFYINNALVYTSTVALAASKNLVPLIGIASHHASNKKNMQVFHIYMSRLI